VPEEVTVGTGRKTLRKADGPPCGQCLRARDVAHPSGPSEQSRIGKSLEWLTHSFSELTVSAQVTSEESIWRLIERLRATPVNKCARWGARLVRSR
jgi:hypothetical protein